MIENGFLRAGKFSIQITNIVSMSILDNTPRALKATGIGYAVAFLLIFVLSRSLLVAIAASPIGALLSFYYIFSAELLMITSAGTTFRLFNKSKESLGKVKGAIEMAKTTGDSYTINHAHTHTEVQANQTNITNPRISGSPGAAIGSNIGTHVVNASPEVKERQKALIDELLQSVRNSKLPEDDKDDAVRHLKNIKEESSSHEPNKNFILASLGKLESIITAAAAGAELFEKAKLLFDMFKP